MPMSPEARYLRDHFQKERTRTAHRIKTMRLRYRTQRQELEDTLAEMHEGITRVEALLTEFKTRVIPPL